MRTFQDQGSDQRRFKYGVIGIDHAVNDLKNWEDFAFAGRLHKPVLPFHETDHEFNVDKAIEINRDQALCLAILLNYEKLSIDMLDLATFIC